MPTLGRNEAAVRRCVDHFNKRTLEWVDTCFAENAERTAPMPGYHGAASAGGRLRASQAGPR